MSRPGLDGLFEAMERYGCIHHGQQWRRPGANNGCSAAGLLIYCLMKCAAESVRMGIRGTLSVYRVRLMEVFIDPGRKRSDVRYSNDQRWWTEE